MDNCTVSDIKPKILTTFHSLVKNKTTLPPFPCPKIILLKNVISSGLTEVSGSFGIDINVVRTLFTDFRRTTCVLEHMQM